ncbi:MAG TPA: extracellular solute-binding protein [Thermoanaerobaculia bacterium]|jgi:arabinogalactan oligomer/maltooligosaccharide transport system substrate-binding protein|nr:extracellular solute-binding protein [Thermoanaerobaculia bacterium]
MRARTLTRSFPVLLTLASFLLLPALAAAQKEIVIWHAYRGAEKTAFEKVVDQFNKSHTGIKATTLAVPYDAFADKITAAVPRGKGPDVFIYAQDRLGGWVAAGNTVEPIDFFLDAPTKGRFLSTTLQAMTYQGNVYGLPLNYKVITLIYNKKLVPKPPKTSAEMVTLAKSLTNAASGKFGVAYAYNDFYYHAAVMNGFGGGVFDGRKPTLNSAPNVKAAETLMSWLGDGFLPAEPSTALITALFNQGKAAMVFSGPWFLGEISGVDFGLAPLPTLSEAGGKPMRPWITVEGVYIATPSKNKDAAYEFVKYVTDAPAARTLALEGRQSPANKAVYSDPQVAADPILKAFRQQVDVAIPMPNLPEMTMVWTPATTAMNTIVKKAATPKAALDQAQKEVLDRISKLRK